MQKDKNMRRCKYLPPETFVCLRFEVYGLLGANTQVHVGNDFEDLDDQIATGNYVGDPAGADWLEYSATYSTPSLSSSGAPRRRSLWEDE